MLQVSSVVCSARMISTSCIIGIGLKKCMPMTRPGTFEAEAMRVTEIDEVLVARMASARRSTSSWPITSFFRSNRSSTASTTTSQSASSSIFVVGAIRSALRPILRRQLFPSDEPLEALLDRAHAAAERRLCDVAQPRTE